MKTSSCVAAKLKSNKPIEPEYAGEPVEFSQWVTPIFVESKSTVRGPLTGGILRVLYSKRIISFSHAFFCGNSVMDSVSFLPLVVLSFYLEQREQIPSSDFERARRSRQDTTGRRRRRIDSRRTLSITQLLQHGHQCIQCRCHRRGDPIHSKSTPTERVT